MTCNNLKLDMLLAQQRKAEEREKQDCGLGYVAGKDLFDYFERYYSEIYTKYKIKW